MSSKMSKKKLFDDDSDEDIAIKTENEYAKKYDTWREKEEIHKLEQKYGLDALNSDGAGSSDSEDDSDEPLEVSEEIEAQFLKTLALLKTKDPRIYDPNYKCFQEDEKKEPVKETKSKALTFEDSDDDDDQDGDIFKIEKKAEIDDVKETMVKTDGEASKKKKVQKEKIKEYLTGQAEHIDNDVEKDLAPLKALWSDPKLNEGEAFLRDYILNKRYLDDDEAGDADGRVRDDDELEADEAAVEEQSKFERAYNFRFEEPDEEYLKRFPRTMNYIRPKDDRRSRKRAEVRARKEEEKRRKMEEIARLKSLKLKEIQDKLKRIKEVTGNDELAFKEEDIEGEFDPEEHDRRMRAMFDERYYGHADDAKPTFPDLDEELEIENWDHYDVDNPVYAGNQNEDGLHCEDADFNMDADYDPTKYKNDLQQEIEKTLGKKRRNRKRQSKLSQILAREKPKFLPLAEDRTYAQHMQEYYQLDCEDVVAGMPTRFKYREVVPNDYGLTVEEILLADDKELTQWVPLKKIVKYRPDAAERGDVATYKQRARDERLKKKLLPSLYRDLPEDPEIAVPVEQTKKKKKTKNKDADETNDKKVSEAEDNAQNSVLTDDEEDADSRETTNDKNNKKLKRKLNAEQASSSIPTENPIIDYNTQDDNKNKKSKRKKKLQHETEVSNENIPNEINEDENTKIKKKKLKINSIKEETSLSNEFLSKENVKDETVKKKKSKLKNKFASSDVGDVSKKYQTNGVDNEIKDNDAPQTNNNKVTKKKQKLKTQQPGDTNLTPGKTGKIEKIKSKKHKLKNKNKFKSKQSPASDNPLGKLSDERLKAYGLNPKKYRGFLRYKKF